MFEEHHDKVLVAPIVFLTVISNLFIGTVSVLGLFLPVLIYFNEIKTSIKQSVTFIVLVFLISASFLYLSTIALMFFSMLVNQSMVLGLPYTDVQLILAGVFTAFLFTRLNSLLDGLGFYRNLSLHEIKRELTRKIKHSNQANA